MCRRGARGDPRRRAAPDGRELRAEVEALLESHDRLGDFLNAPDRAVIAVPENDDAVCRV